METTLQADPKPPVDDAKLQAEIKQYKFVINKLIGTINEANGLLLTAASGSNEPDRLINSMLEVCKELTQSLADVAKV